MQVLKTPGVYVQEIATLPPSVAEVSTAIPAFVGGALVLHAVTGRYPLMPVLRRLGVRTSREIARERYALKALRGDFIGVGSAATASSHDRTEAA